MLSCGVNTSARWFSEEFYFFCVALGPGSRRYRVFADRLEGCSWFLLRFEWFPDGVIVTFKRGDVGREGYVAYLWRAAFSLLLALLNSRQSSGAWVFFCQVDLAVRFNATRRLMSEGKFLAGLGGFLLGVAICAACCRIPMNVVVAASTSSLVLSFIAEFTFSRITV